MDVIRNYPVGMRERDDPAPQTLYYECEMPQDGAGRYTRPDARIPGSREFELRTVYRGVITREVQHVSDEN